MTKEEIIENNKLIAEFMGFNFNPTGWEHLNDLSPAHKYSFYESKNGSGFLLRDCQYHESWDWLMPVLEKIIPLGYSYELHYEWLVIRGNDQPRSECITRSDDDYAPNTTTLQLAYETISGFIKWYNENK